MPQGNKGKQREAMKKTYTSQFTEMNDKSVRPVVIYNVSVAETFADLALELKAQGVAYPNRVIAKVAKSYLYWLDNLLRSNGFMPLVKVVKNPSEKGSLVVMARSDKEIWDTQARYDLIEAEAMNEALKEVAGILLKDEATNLNALNVLHYRSERDPQWVYPTRPHYCSMYKSLS